MSSPRALEDLQHSFLDQVREYLWKDGHTSEGSSLLLATLGQLPSWQNYKHACKGTKMVANMIVTLSSSYAQELGLAVCRNPIRGADGVYLATDAPQPAQSEDKTETLEEAYHTFFTSLHRRLIADGHSSPASALKISTIAGRVDWQKLRRAAQPATLKPTTVMTSDRARSYGILVSGHKAYTPVTGSPSPAPSSATTTTAAASAGASSATATHAASKEKDTPTYDVGPYCVVKSIEDWRKFCEAFGKEAVVAVDVLGDLDSDTPVALVQVFLSGARATYLLHRSSWFDSDDSFAASLKRMFEDTAHVMVMYRARSIAEKLRAAHAIDISKRPWRTLFDLRLAAHHLHEDVETRTALHHLYGAPTEALGKYGAKRPSDNLWGSAVLSRRSCEYAVACVCYSVDIFAAMNAALGDTPGALDILFSASRDSTLHGLSQHAYIELGHNTLIVTDAPSPRTHVRPESADISDTEASLIDALPVACQTPVRNTLTATTDALSTIILDVGRPITLGLASFSGPRLVQCPETVTPQMLADLVVRVGDLHALAETGQVPEHDPEDVVALALESTISLTDAPHTPFFANRSGGIPGTLHRVAWFPNTRGTGIGGITCRVGRPVLGLVDLFRDFVLQHIFLRRESVLIVGGHGAGTTTLLRAFTHILASEEATGASVVAVGKHCTMGGAGDVPHSILGPARRIPVHSDEELPDAISEATSIHAAAFVMIDDIDDTNTASAVQNALREGIPIVAAVTATSLATLMHSRVAFLVRNSTKPHALRRHGTNPLFETIVECSLPKYVVHTNGSQAVRALANNQPLPPSTQVRWIDANRNARCYFGNPDDVSLHI